MVQIYCDGGALNNQDAKKRSGYGSFMVTRTAYPDHATGKIASKFIDLGKSTNNQAEYKTLLAALNYCIQEFIAEPTIYTDSDLIVKQVSGEYKVREAELKPLNAQAKEEIALIKAKLEKIDRSVIVAVLGH